MNTNPDIMVWMRDEYEKQKNTYAPAVITGKPLSFGGSLGRDTVSYFEWSQGLSGEQWTAEKVDNELKRVILDAYKAVRREARREEVSYRHAAFAVGVKTYS